MAKRLTDRQKKKIVADFAELGTIAATARKNRVARDTVSRTLRENPDVAEIVTGKKDENTMDMLAFMDSRKDKAQSFVDRCLEILDDDEKISAAQLSQITTAMGTVIDKFAPTSKDLMDRERSLEVTFRVVDKCD